MPKVSVIIPTYNYGKYIEKAIDSVFAQTYRDFEIIVVDDGSTDNTREIIETRYKDKVRYFYQENKGAPVARNFGLRKAKGEFVTFLDADDYFMRGALFSRVDFLEEHPSYGWVYGPWFVCRENNDDITQLCKKLPLAFNKPQQGNILEFLLLGGLLVSTTVMLRSDLVRGVKGFKEDLQIYQDYELWLRIARFSPIGFIESQNVVVVRHEGSLGHMSNDGYRTLAGILRDAEQRWPDVVCRLGYQWKRRSGFVLAERGRYLTSLGNRISGRKLLAKAIVRDPFYIKHYVGYLKTWI